jgi:hypothetical protein
VTHSIIDSLIDDDIPITPSVVGSKKAIIERSNIEEWTASSKADTTEVFMGDEWSLNNLMFGMMSVF